MKDYFCLSMQKCIEQIGKSRSHPKTTTDYILDLNLLSHEETDFSSANCIHSVADNGFNAADWQTELNCTD